ncbi:unnamed protein product [Vitrella brassicaformis CCMP3155]|uniref:PLD phosphodiesterase domain-containing protein n=1 Tax=Vitrella brassicaformis (strain CCMP3155) TaxID=1169540 RepID=A0A0G4FUY1_VITBC|nr:unnamed protein product [Vitrella brassicaformis CCMP3155]|eukprot:CEM18762.1 unnamed protein product [Vitrella brassicaformis CCMP3155]
MRIDLTDDASAGNSQDLAQDEASDLLGPAPKKARVCRTAWLWRCQPFYLNAIVDYGRDGEENEGCLSIRDVVDGPVQEMLLTSTRFDLPWLVDECPVMKTIRRIAVLTGDPRTDDPQDQPSKEERLRLLVEAANDLSSYGPAVTVEAVPLTDQHGRFHPKLIFLTYADRIRVCISSANFTHSDWWRKNQIINVQDFPRKLQQGSQPSTDMEDQLAAFLRATTKAGGWCDKIRQFDYSTAIGKIVASVPGSHAGSDVHRWGHMRMRRLLSGQPGPKGLEDHAVVCQVALLDSLEENWIEEFIGRSPHTTTAPALHVVCASAHPTLSWRQPLTWRLILPTIDEVRTSLEGWAADKEVQVMEERLMIADMRVGTTTPLPEGLLHRWGLHKANGERACCGAAIPHPPDRTSASPHLDTFLKYGRRSGDVSKRREVAWIYVGSHNFSKAA